MLPRGSFQDSKPRGFDPLQPVDLSRADSQKLRVSPHLGRISLFRIGDSLFQCHGPAFVPRRLERRVIDARYTRSLNATFIAWPLGRRNRQSDVRPQAFRRAPDAGLCTRAQA